MNFTHLREGSVEVFLIGHEFFSWRKDVHSLGENHAEERGFPSCRTGCFPILVRIDSRSMSVVIRQRHDEADMHRHSSYAYFAHQTATVLRWLRLIEVYGGHTAALEALLRDSQNLEHLMCSMRSCGINPDLLIKEAELIEGNAKHPTRAAA
jgi:hypothetical protein